MIRKSRGSGFTLIEALAVVTIVGIVLPAAMYCMQISNHAADQVKMRAQAMEVAHSQLNLAILRNSWQNGDQQGDEDRPAGKFHWTTHVQDWAQANVHELHVDVSWGPVERTRTLSLVTLVYDSGVVQ